MSHLRARVRNVRRPIGRVLLIGILALGTSAACSGARPDSSSTPLPAATATTGPPSITTVVAKVKGAPPDSSSLSAFAAFGYSDLWAVSVGIVFSSNDAGATWSREGDLGQDALSLSFPTASTGWAGTASGLFRTSDGGRTWLPVADAGAPVVRVRFVDALHGWVESGALGLLQTVDGGANWTSEKAPCQGGLFTFASDTDGQILCQQGPNHGDVVGKELYATKDGGRSWTKLAPSGLGPQGLADDLFWMDATHVWMATDLGIEVSGDGGLTWTNQATTGALAEFGGVQFADPQHGYALLGTLRQAVRRVLLRTDDGGLTWHQVYPAVQPQGAQYFDATHAVGMGTDTDPAAVLSSTDGGRTWHIIGESPRPDLGYRIFSFGDARHGWLGIWYQGEQYLYRTTDGGRSWTPIPVNYELLELSFVDANTGYAVPRPNADARRRNGPSLLVTHDGGKTFAPVRGSNLPGGYATIHFATRSYGWRNGFVPSAGPRLQATNDGGESWATILPGYDLWSPFDLAHDRSGWVVAQQVCSPSDWVTPGPTRGPCRPPPPALMSTKDGGRTWSRFQLGAMPAPNQVHAVDAQHAWIEYFGGATYATSDGGRTWTRTDAP